VDLRWLSPISAASVTRGDAAWLTLIFGPLEDTLAQSEGLSPQDRERLGLVRRSSLRLLKLVNRLLDFSRIEAGRVEVSFEATDLSSLTADLAVHQRFRYNGRDGFHLGGDNRHAQADLAGEFGGPGCARDGTSVNGGRKIAC
jgi:signal transduction histidine kinase